MFNMRNYDRINAPSPKDIDQKQAHIIGSGIAGLSAAIALVADAHMPAGNVTLHVDHPFLFLIIDHSSGTILFVGRVLDPR